MATVMGLVLEEYFFELAHGVIRAGDLVTHSSRVFVYLIVITTLTERERESFEFFLSS